MTQAKADRKAEEIGLNTYQQHGSRPRTFWAVGKVELFREADVVSLHYVLSERSKGSRWGTGAKPDERVCFAS